MLICVGIYLFQEKLLFFPEKLPSDYQYRFPYAFEELQYQVRDNTTLNALLFSKSESKGVVLYLHGNGGAINRWSETAYVFLENKYDVLYLDYRGYGKSEGKIHSEKQLIEDAQTVYDALKEKYTEDQIILLGTSMGTGIATQLAVSNRPQKLILNAPYASLQQLIREKVPIIPSFIIRYTLKTKEYLNKVSCPVYLIHGAEDQLISPAHAETLKAVHPVSKLEIIPDYGHNDLIYSRAYEELMHEILKIP